MAVAAGVIGILLVCVAIIVIVDVFVVNPLKVGCDAWFLTNRDNTSTDFEPLQRGFVPSYKNVVKTVFMKDLFIALWSLLFVIPGIIKTFEYRLVTYILSENPDMDYKEALETSKTLMKGNKWRAFVLDMSFIGWAFLGAITLGLVNLLYLQPYSQATYAELYMAIAHPEEEGEQNTVKFTDASDVEVVTVPGEVEDEYL